MQMNSHVRVFTIKLSKVEEEFLRREAKRKNKSMAQLIREGSLNFASHHYLS